MELKRDIYQALISWKKNNSGKVLELEGARQTGKTFIIDKFARENFKRYLYINMLQISGEQFLKCLEKATYWEPGMDQVEHPIHNAFILLNKTFEDDKDTIIVIDEIQESAKVYSLIRQFAREFECHFIVAGSYMGKTLEKGYFFSAGDTDVLTLYTLSFEEFLDAFDKRHLFDDVGLYGKSRQKAYDELKFYYELYCQTGGYPAVVNKYLETQDILMVKEEILWIIQIFIKESQRYCKDILEINLFDQIFSAIAQSMLKEKTEYSDLITELSGIIYEKESNQNTNKSVNYMIAWLHRSHIIGFCGQANDCNPITVSMNSRLYFLDLGVCQYFLDKAGADLATIRGLVSKNFVYIDLLKRAKTMKIAGTDPMFGTYKEGEIDFLVNSRENYKNYGIEVKAGNSAGQAVQQLLKDGKVEAVYFLKSDVYGGLAERMVTVPIYLVSRIQFDWEGETGGDI